MVIDLWSNLDNGLKITFKYTSVLFACDPVLIFCFITIRIYFKNNTSGSKANKTKAYLN